LFIGHTALAVLSLLESQSFQEIGLLKKEG
jgi:hypothetical protein